MNIPHTHTFVQNKPEITDDQLGVFLTLSLVLFVSFEIERIFYKLESGESLMLDASNEVVEQQFHYRYRETQEMFRESMGHAIEVMREILHKS